MRSRAKEQRQQPDLTSVRYSVGVKSLILALSLLGLLAIGAVAQLVQLGPKSESLRDYCARVEPLRPNLLLREDSQITGRVSDQSGDVFRNSRIELRRFVSSTNQVLVKNVSTDGDGNFDLGIVKRGDYRLLLSYSRAFQQPEKLSCGDKECKLEAVLLVNATDLPASVCPIR